MDQKRDIAASVKMTRATIFVKLGEWGAWGLGLSRAIQNSVIESSCRGVRALLHFHVLKDG